jgi:hypothetical protein
MSDNSDVGLGCGFPIVLSTVVLPYPESLSWPRPPFGGRLVPVALGGPRNLTVSQGNISSEGLPY